MKKMLMITVAAVFLFSCNKETDGYLINGTIDNIEDGEKAILEIVAEQGGFSVIDSTTVKNGIFKFNGKTDEIQIGYIQIGEINMKIPFVLENEKITVTAYKDSIHASKVTGSYNNGEFVRFSKEFELLQKEIQQKMQQFEIDNMEAIAAARENNNQAALRELSSQYQAIGNDVLSFMEEYTSENSKSYVSVLLLSEIINNPNADFQKAKTNFEALDTKLKSTKIGKRIEEQIKSLSSTAIGQIAPDFSAPDPDGKMVSLKESLGKITLIDFWASWCGPCRVENPNVVALYNEFHQKGLNIIGVSLDRENQKDKWLEAIATDKLTWTQVSNLQFWQDPIAQQYSVQSIPATFLLDAEGRIVAKNLRGAQLRAKVQELLED